MNTDKTTYVYLFTVGVVLVVAVLLSIASLFFSEEHNANAALQRQKDILHSIRIATSEKNTPEQYSHYIKDTIFLDATGNVLTPSMDTTHSLSIYVADKNDTMLYIIPMKGYGLWGPIWGYVALEGDFNTIYGVAFDHKSETSGLGAEITSSGFTSQFDGKKIFDSAGNEAFTVVKGSTEELSPDKKIYAVDGITGATITSEGVKNMIRTSLGGYVPFFDREKQKANE